MGGLRAHNLSISLDGYLAGPAQSEQDPIGIGGKGLHEWIFSEAVTDVDRRFLARGEDGIGATIMA
jgi:hypothetical protein